MRIAHHAPARPDATASASDETTYAAFALAAGEWRPAAEYASAALQKIASNRQADAWRDLEARSQLILGKALMRLSGAGAACPVLARSLQTHRAVFDPVRSPDVADAARTFAACQGIATR